jgi:hypothetical protein
MVMSFNGNAIAAVTTFIYNPTVHNYHYACRTIGWCEVAYLNWVKPFGLTPDTRIFIDLKAIVDTEMQWNIRRPKIQNTPG